MGKKRRILTNIKKFGKKHFEFLDQADGTDDGRIQLENSPTVIHSLNLANNDDQTIRLSATIFGSSSAPRARLRYRIDGGSYVNETEPARMGLITTGTGFEGEQFTSSLPALQIVDNGSTGKFPHVLSAGAHTVTAQLYNSGAAGTTIAELSETITVRASNTNLSLAGAAQMISGSTQINLSLTAITASGPQHGSGSGVGITGYGFDPSTTTKHGFKLTLSGAIDGAIALKLTGSTLANGAARTNVLTNIIAHDSASVPQTVFFTFTPYDVNNAAVTAQAVVSSSILR
tara:strand:+ start:302 stop:1165 length:864 start_codon:yes stop_codon:yes gene_type:complete